MTGKRCMKLIFLIATHMDYFQHELKPGLNNDYHDMAVAKIRSD